jgi:hypothetical protein
MIRHSSFGVERRSGRPALFHRREYSFTGSVQNDLKSRKRATLSAVAGLPLARAGGTVRPVFVGYNPERIDL